MNARLGLAAALTATTMLLAACGSSGGTAAPASQAPSAAASEAAPSQPADSGAPAAAACEVAGSGGTAAEIKGFAFPAGISVAAGEAVTWTNADSAPHTVTFQDGSCDSGSIPAGGSLTVTYTTAGTYPIVCKIHPTMTGSIEVR